MTGDDPSPVPPTGDDGDDPSPVPPTDNEVSKDWRGIKLLPYKDNVYVMINHTGKTPEKILFNHDSGEHITRTPGFKYISRSTYYPDGYAFPEIETQVKQEYGQGIRFHYSNGKISYKIEQGFVDARMEIYSIDGSRQIDIFLPLSDGMLHSIEIPEYKGFFMARLSGFNNAGQFVMRNIKFVQ